MRRCARRLDEGGGEITMTQGEKTSRDWAALDAALGRDAPLVDPDFERRLLADYDTIMRSRRANPLAALADAFGWRALARPYAPAALAAAMVMMGGLVGAVTTPAADDDVFIYLTAGLDLSADFSAEVAAWADQ